MIEPRPRPLLEVRELQVAFERDGRSLPAVRGIDLDAGNGECLALVGESGSGKSVTALALMGLLPEPPACITGEVRLAGRDLRTLRRSELRQARGRDLAIVFQDPMASLNPYLPVGVQVVEAVELHRGLRGRRARDEAVALLAEAGIPDAARRARFHPHQLSGGLRQRVMIAMALAGRPKLLIADEPTTALDVTVQAQILELFQRLVCDRAMALLLITHDLGVVAALADRVAVIHAGRIVETGPVRELFAAPRHPYTIGLLNALPRIDGARPPRAIPGMPPLPGTLPAGCAFAPRCPIRLERCALEDPPLEPAGGTSHVACHAPGEATAALRGEGALTGAGNAP